MNSTVSKSVSDHLIGFGTKAVEALEVIRGVNPKLAVIIDAQGKFRGTVSECELRRGLNEGLSLESPIDQFPVRSDLWAADGTPSDQLRHTLIHNMVDCLILLTKDETPVGLVDIRSVGEGVNLSPPHMGTSELSFIRDAFAENYIAPAGGNLNRLEESLAEVSGKSHALAVSSGTAALHLALRVVDVRRGDKVYVSNLTFVASLQPILYEGCIPILIDSEPVSWNMSPVALARRLALDASRDRLPRAIIVVHLYGQSADMDAIVALANQYDVPIIEDAAESLGATYRQRPSGAHGLLSAYSFNGNKIITTSGGGALVSDDDELIARARNLSTQGRDNYEHYQHSTIAYNYRMSNVLAGIGCGQLQVLADRVEARRLVHLRYRERLGDIPGIGFQEDIDGSVGNRWLTVITLDPDHVPLHCFQVIRGLRDAGIEARPGWKPMTMQPLFHGADYEPHSHDEDCASRLFLQSVCLPSGSALNPATHDRVCDRLIALIGD